VWTGYRIMLVILINFRLWTSKVRIGSMTKSVLKHLLWERALSPSSVTHRSKNPYLTYIHTYRGADKFLARPGRKQATATEDFDVHISYL
jgi:hypothetical protein